MRRENNESIPEHFSEEQIYQIGNEVCSSMIELDVYPDTQVSSSDPVSDGWSAWVEIRGSWSGVVVFSCDDQLASKVASAMFFESESKISNTQKMDAIGEISNMFGGSFKALLEDESTLSIPKIQKGKQIEDITDNNAELRVVRMTCSEGNFRIGLATGVPEANDHTLDF